VSGGALRRPVSGGSTRHPAGLREGLEAGAAFPARGEESAFVPPSALYAHVPLCRSRCPYCDFYSNLIASVAESAPAALVEATLERARGLAGRFGSSRLETVYVGGGTPTVLPPRLLGGLLGGLRALAPRCVEATVEANPESLDRERLDALFDAGATRISLGVQSLDDDVLGILGRPHDAAAAERAAALVSAASLLLSADLIAGAPRLPERGGRKGAQSPMSLAAQAARLLEMGACHLSMYDLTVEEGTTLASALRSGELVLPGEDEAFEEREEAESILSGAGFRRYEISNYAKPGSECLHNQAYWSMDSYIGAGPGAVSTIRRAGSPGLGSSLRIEEPRTIEAYGASAAAETEIPPRDSAFEVVMMAFRTALGLDLDGFRSRFGLDARALLSGTLARWAERLVEISASRIALDPRGLDLSNRFLADCLIELEATFPL
jgi:oxygen-independent coproporphyrinogen-3 oxidase